MPDERRNFSQSDTGEPRLSTGKMARRSNLTPEERSLRAQMAAHLRWASVEDRREATRAAREAAASRFERQVDPDGVLSLTERAIRAEHAQKAHMLRMSIAAKAARRRAG